MHVQLSLIGVNMSILPTSSTMASGMTMLALLGACGGGAPASAPAENRSVTLVASQPNAVSHWHDIAVTTVNTPGSVATTPEELRTVGSVDLATVHLAIYDAVSAIDGRFKPYAVTPMAPAAGASMEAAISAAAYGVLRSLFPNRASQYQAAYDEFLGRIAAGEAKDKGQALGAEVASGIVAQRANDGRAISLAPYVAGTAPGKFRGANPVARFQPAIRPFALSRVDQFRAPPPPALESAAYAADFNEVKALGGTASTSRTPEQLDIARFHTEAPPFFLTRNFGQFARTTSSVVDAARLMALIYVVNADALNACFEAKYHYDSWRPQSAIPLAGTDNNAQTEADAAWTPAVPTPNHPEYPAAHGCTVGGLSELLRQHYGTSMVSFSLDSKVTGATRSYATTDALVDEVKVARIHGGMHFRFSTVAGVDMGVKVADWTIQHHFGRRR